MNAAMLGAQRAHGGALDQFAACWDKLDDPRTGNAGLHDFHELLITALRSVLCGGQGAVDMALFAKSKEPLLATRGASLRGDDACLSKPLEPS